MELFHDFSVFIVERQSTTAGKATANKGPMTNLLPDEELMSQVRSGVGEMLGVLFDRYQMPLFNFFYKLTGNRTMSEDLVQEVFFRILKYRQSYRPGTPFRAWMYQIARNARVDFFRRQRPEVSWQPEVEAAVMPGDSAQQKQETDMLYRALLQCRKKRRKCSSSAASRD